MKSGFYSTKISDEEREARAAWERAVIEDMGGPGAISTAQRALVSATGFLKLRLDRLDQAYAEGHEPANEHIMALINSLRLNLRELGLERRAKPPQSLTDYIAQKQRGIANG